MARNKLATIRRRLGRSLLPNGFAWLTSDRLRVLAYHGVPDETAFARHVDLLLTEYNVLSLAEVESAFASGHAPPPRSVLLTFDDGERSVFERAFPVLRAAGIPAALYVVTALVGTTEPFWWDLALRGFEAGGRTRWADATDASGLIAALKSLPDYQRRHAVEELADAVVHVTQPQLTDEELRELARGCIAVGSHTATHPCLDRCDTSTVRFEIEQAHRRLTEILGVPPTSFAYPNGNYDRRAERLLADLGYRSAFLFDHRPHRLPGNALRISRIRVNAGSDVDAFRLMVSGAHPFFHHGIMRRS